MGDLPTVGDLPPLFEFDQVTVAPNGRGTILDVDFLEVPDKGITVLAGPSGAGKSTMLRLCNRLEVPSSGQVRHRGTDLATLDPLALRRRVGMVFQRPTMFAGTVRQNLGVARPDGGDEEFADALERAGLDGSFLDRTGDDLSGGEAQRACLARTLLTDPRVLLMDEPTSALDFAVTRRLEQAVRMLADDQVPVLWVTHDLPQAHRIADQTVVLVGGRVADRSTAARYLSGEDRVD
jgi:putative ABC transport system ATP-binding protein